MCIRTLNVFIYGRMWSANLWISSIINSTLSNNTDLHRGHHWNTTSSGGELWHITAHLKVITAKVRGQSVLKVEQSGFLCRTTTTFGIQLYQGLNYVNVCVWFTLLLQRVLLYSLNVHSHQYKESQQWSVNMWWKSHSYIHYSYLQTYLALAVV